MRLLSNMGLSVGPKAVYKKKVELQDVQRKKIKDTVLQQRQQEEIKAKADELSKPALMYRHLTCGGVTQSLQQTIVSSLEGDTYLNQLHELAFTRNHSGNLQNLLQVPVSKR